jgi:hypothetical protein
MIPAPAWYVYNPIPVQHWYKPFLEGRMRSSCHIMRKNESKGHTFRYWGHQGHQNNVGFSKKLLPCQTSQIWLILLWMAGVNQLVTNHQLVTEHFVKSFSIFLHFDWFKML